METPHISSERYVQNNSLREAHSQSVKLESSTLKCFENTDILFPSSRYKEDDKLASNSSKSSPNWFEEMKEEPERSKSFTSGAPFPFKDGNDAKMFSLDLDSIVEKKKKSYARKHYYSPEVTEILMNWLRDHIYYPYPTEEERIQLCEKTGLTRKQLRVWLINTRKVSSSRRQILNFTEEAGHGEIPWENAEQKRRQSDGKTGRE